MTVPRTVPTRLHCISSVVSGDTICHSSRPESSREIHGREQMVTVAREFVFVRVLAPDEEPRLGRTARWRLVCPEASPQILL
jgi:hypothetical protein